MDEALDRILRSALAEADRRGVQHPRLSHLAASDARVLAQRTVEYLRTRRSQPSPRSGWVQVASFDAGVNRWWKLQLEETFSRDVRARFQTLRKEIYDHLEDEQHLIQKPPGQNSPIHLAPTGDVLDAPSLAARPQQIAVSSCGAGFGDADSNRIAEAAAMAATIGHFIGWTHDDVSHERCGWDITFRREAEEFHAEVKGVAGRKLSVLLTGNEYAVAERDDRWRLIVVTRALVAPQVQEVDRLEALGAARPYLFRINLGVRDLS